MPLRKKKSLMTQAADAVESIIPTIEAAVGSAREKAGPLLHDARDKAVDVFGDAVDKAGPLVSDARDKAVPLVSDARDKAAGALSDARDTAVPYVVSARDTAATALVDARDKAAPYVADARDKAVGKIGDARDSAVPLIAQGRAVAAEKVSSGRDLAATRLAPIVPGIEPPKKSHTLRNLLVVTGLAGLAAFVYKRLTASDDSWQQTYTPAPASDAPTTVATPPPGVDPVDDAAAATPDEAFSDAIDEPHDVTSPDEPVVVVDIVDTEDEKHDS